MAERICVAVARETVEEALVMARQVSSQADVIEIRLDYLKDPQILPFLAGIEIPLLFTNRPVWEGGKFTGDENSRISPLMAAAEKQAAFIDLELRAPAESLCRLQTEIEGSATRLVLSWHDFIHTPVREELVDVLHTMQNQGAHIGKIVTMAHNYLDVLRVLQLQEDAALMRFPLIAFCMGRPGIISRLATLELGGYMTYCSPDNDCATAPGQLSANVLRQIYERMFP
jgi:3-dehydroquinate dehydratase I